MSYILWPPTSPFLCPYPPSPHHHNIPGNFLAETDIKNYRDGDRERFKNSNTRKLITSGDINLILTREILLSETTLKPSAYNSA